jgi:hypothetical protein
VSRAAAPKPQFKTLWTGYDDLSELRLRVARVQGRRTLRLESRASPAVRPGAKWQPYPGGAHFVVLGALADLLEAQR